MNINALFGVVVVNDIFRINGGSKFCGVGHFAKLFKIILINHHTGKGAGIDYAACADRDSFRTEEIKIAADFPVAQGINCAVDVDFFINEVSERSQIVELHIGNLPSIQFKIGELIDANGV